MAVAVALMTVGTAGAFIVPSSKAGARPSGPVSACVLVYVCMC